MMSGVAQVASKFQRTLQTNEEKALADESYFAEGYEFVNTSLDFYSQFGNMMIPLVAMHDAAACRHVRVAEMELQDHQRLHIHRYL